MYFIGIIDENNSYKFIKDKVCDQIEVININNNNIDSIKNIKFNAIVIVKINEMVEKEKIFISDALNGSEYLILNTDEALELSLSKEKGLNIITFGLNHKATVTVSSIKEDSMMVCLQRNIKNCKGNIIEPFEYKIKCQCDNNNELYNVLIAFIIEQIYKN